MATKSPNVIPTLVALAVGLGALAPPLAAQDVRPIPLLPARRRRDPVRRRASLHGPGSGPAGDRRVDVTVI